MVELASLPMFAGLSEEQLACIGERSSERTVEAGREIVGQGERSDQVFIVLEGSVKISRHRQDGREVILSVVGAGEVVGDVAGDSAADQPSSVVTFERTRFLSMHRDEFLSLLRELAPLQLGVLESLNRRLRLAESRQEILAALDVEGRVASVLLVLADAHGEPKPTGGIRIRFPFTQSDVAAMTGASRVRVNQILSRFRQKGWITMDGQRRTSLQDIEQLRRRSR